MKLTIEQLEERIAPSIVVENPAGHTPPGQQDADQGAAKGG